MDRFTDRTVVITGGGSGIGKATANRLAQQGAQIALASRNRDALERVRIEIEQAGGKALPAHELVTWLERERGNGSPRRLASIHGGASRAASWASRMSRTVLRPRRAQAMSTLSQGTSPRYKAELAMRKKVAASAGSEPAGSGC